MWPKQAELARVLSILVGRLRSAASVGQSSLRYAVEQESGFRPSAMGMGKPGRLWNSGAQLRLSIRAETRRSPRLLLYCMPPVQQGLLGESLSRRDPACFFGGAAGREEVTLPHAFEQGGRKKVIRHVLFLSVLNRLNS